MKPLAILQKIGRALVVYAGVAYVGDQLVRPHWAVHKAKVAAARVDKPLLVVGYQLTRPLGDFCIDLADAPSFPLPVEDGSIGAVLLLHALEHAADPLALAIETERVLVEGGEALVTSTSPYMLHAWFGRRWVLFNVDEGRKHAVPLWSARKPLSTAPPLEAAETPVEAEEEPVEPTPSEPLAEGV